MPLLLESILSKTHRGDYRKVASNLLHQPHRIHLQSNHNPEEGLSAVSEDPVRYTLTKMKNSAEISARARKLFDFMPEKSWMTAANLARAIKVRKAEISFLLDELEEARLIDVFFYINGKRANPRRRIVKVRRRKPRVPASLLNAIYIGFPIDELDRDSIIEVYLKFKLPIVPFEPLGKKPITSLNSWQRLSDIAKLDYFFKNPTLNVGLRLPRGLCVIDLDTRNQIWSAMPAFQQTLTVSTARGFHHYFMADAVVNITTASVLPDIDTRCNGSFVVIPPSTHQSGVTYRWANVVKLQQLPIAFRREWRKAYFASCGYEGKFRLLSIIPQGARNDTLWKYGRSLRARGYSYHEIEVELHAVNAECCIPRLSYCEMVKLIEHIWEHPNKN